MKVAAHKSGDVDSVYTQDFKSFNNGFNVVRSKVPLIENSDTDDT